MSDFTKAFAQGQRAVDRAEAARSEIASVFAAMAKDVATASQGKVELKIVEYKSPLANFVYLANSALFDPSVPKPGTERWISARNPERENSEFRRLAKWSEEYDGYPCTLSYLGREVRCHDRESLEIALIEFLEAAWIAEKLREVIAESE